MAASTRTLIRLIVALTVSLGATTIATVATAAASPGIAFASGGDTWTAQGDGSHWSDGDNWSSGVPQDGDSVTIAPTLSQAAPDVQDMPSGTKLADLTLTDASLNGGSATVSGDLTWSVSTGERTLGAAVTVRGSASLGGLGTKLSSEPLTFDGDTDVSAGFLETEDTGPAITSSGTFTIDPGATVQADECCASVGKFINAGRLAVPQGGAATLTLMDLVDQGSISVASGGQLLVTRGQTQFSPSVGISGGGTVTFDQGTAARLAKSITVGTGTTVQLTGNATFDGTGGLTGPGEFLWTGGTIFATMSVASKTSISGTAAKELAAPAGKPVTLTLHGPTTLSGSGVLGFSQANITTAGTFTMKPGTTIRAGECCVSPDKFTNLGTLAVPGAGVATVAFADFIDQGSVSVGKGALLEVDSGPGELAAGKKISGGGTVDFDRNAAISVAKNVSIGAGATVQLSGGAAFSGTGGFTGTGALLWTGGTIEGNLSIAVPLTISGTSAKNLASETSKLNTLTLRGPTRLTGSGVLHLGGNVTLDNEGTMTASPGSTVEAGVCCVHPDHFINGGTLIIPAGHGTTFAFLAFVNKGTLSVRPAGVLTVSATFSQAKSGVFATAVSGSAVGRLVVSGAATLAGTIKVSATKLGKVKSFQVLRFQTRSGKFTTVSGKPRFTVSYQGSVRIKYS